MDKKDAELFNDSLDRCSSRPGFLDRFYEIFLASSDEAAKKFARTDFQEQTRMLKASLYIMMVASSGRPEFNDHLQQIAKLHSRTELDIKPELYDQWLDCLLQAVKEFDPLFDLDIETAWRRVLQYGIEFMKSRY
jgi:hemoglobin-like flavoprotein